MDGTGPTACGKRQQLADRGRCKLIQSQALVLGLEGLSASPGRLGRVDRPRPGVEAERRQLSRLVERSGCCYCWICFLPSPLTPPPPRKTARYLRRLPRSASGAADRVLGAR